MWLVDWLRDLISSFLGTLGLVNKEASIIIIGLDNAGKSTLLHRLAKKAFGTFAPTEKPIEDEFQVAGVSFKAWDLGGHEAVRQIWEDFLPECDGVVFVVDSADSERLRECQEELSALSAESALYEVPIAVLFNKDDLPFALSNEELEKGLNWKSLERRDGPIKNFRVSVLRESGYTEAFQWLAQFC
jgi:GTP-binding protein SAR1